MIRTLFASDFGSNYSVAAGSEPVLCKGGNLFRSALWHEAIITITRLASGQSIQCRFAEMPFFIGSREKTVESS